MLYGALGEAVRDREDENSFEEMFLELETWQLSPPEDEQRYREALLVFLGQKHRGAMRLREKERR